MGDKQYDTVFFYLEKVRRYIKTILHEYHKGNEYKIGIPNLSLLTFVNVFFSIVSGII